MINKEKMKITRLVAAGNSYKVGEESRVVLSYGESIQKVVKIGFSAGTSGVEYVVKLEGGEILQFRGAHSFIATWERR